MILFQNNYPHVLLAHAVSSIAYKQTNDVHGVYKMYFFAVCFAISLVNIIIIYHVLPHSGLVLFEVLFSLSGRTVSSFLLNRRRYGSQRTKNCLVSTKDIVRMTARPAPYPFKEELLKPVDCCKECLLN